MDLAARISQLSPSKRALLEAAISEQLSANDAEIISRQPQRDKAPLSFAQQRLWFLDQLHPGKADYNLPQLLHMQGPLNIAALRNAINTIVIRHEALRTRFTKSNNDGFQCIIPELTLELPVIHLSDHDVSDDTLLRLCKEEAERPFDLTTGPLLRAKLLRLSTQRHVLVITMHHIVSDGWSVKVFDRELGRLYDAYCRGKDPTLAQLPIQYLDYAVWQRQQDALLQQQLKYWKQQLSGAPHALQLPIDKARPAIQSFRGGRHRIDLPSQLGGALKALAQRENATLFMVMLAAYHLLLHRYSGQDDILIGVPIAGRTQPELEDLIGFFVNNLVIRCRFAPQLHFRQYLARVRETTVNAFGHQELPYEKLVEALAPRRDMSRNPLFQVVFSLESEPATPPDMAGLTVTNLDFGVSTAKFDLSLLVEERDGDLRAIFNFATDLFQPTTIERMAGHYLTLLTSIARDPEQRIADLQMLSDGELAHLTRWNETASDYPATASIQRLFAEQVKATPYAIAVSHGDAQLNYETLNRRANRLAHYLNDHGVSPATPVGLYMDRGIDAIVAILAILKTGGAYVPLDTSHPQERLEMIVEDAGLTTIICQAARQESLQIHGVDIISMDHDQEGGTVHLDDNPAVAADGDSLAYVLYTSGSTGRPKGVCIPHKAVNRLVKGTDYVALDGSDVIVQAANLAFDAATFEIWGALLNGGRLHVVDKNVLLSHTEFVRELRNQSVTTLFLTTALFNQMIRRDARAFAGLKQMLFGGEACDPQRVRECLSETPPRRLVHVYGPTETTTFATWLEVHEVAEDARSVPIGRPIANTTCHILDTNRRPQPVGVTGELYIGGAGVAHEYLGRPQLTMDKFVTIPELGGERLYRSGDLARYCADGAIEFVGRNDHQIKLRGFRIEIDEIDTTIKGHPLVRDCLTILRDDDPEDKRLVSYVVAEKGQASGGQVLHHYLRKSLPEYMMPSAFVFLEELPLTANGKVDRQALPIPAALNSREADASPRNPLELHLTKIWEHILNRSPIGIHDNFFELGGHSLLAVRLFDQIEKHFGKKLPLDTLWFKGATIETLAHILDQGKDTIVWPELVEIKSGGDMTPLFCVHTMGGNLFHYYELARSLSPRLPVYGLQARGVYGKHSPRDTISDIAADCINVMRQQQAHGPYRIAGFSSGGIVAFEMAQQLHAAGEKVATLALLDCFAPGVKLKRSYRRWARKLLTTPPVRELQERLYHRILFPLGLRRLRQLRSIGEAHRWAHWSYQPHPYPGRIDLFIATESGKKASDPLLGWRKLAGGDLLIHPVPGSHGLIVKFPNVEVLAEKLQHILDP